MRLSFFTVAIAALIFACGQQHEEPAVYRQAPFAALSDSISRLPGDAGLYYRRGVLLYQKGEAGLAQKDLIQAWKLAQNEEHALSLARVLSEQPGESALLFLDTAIRTLPGSIGLKVTQATLLFEQGENERSLAVLEPILATYPGQLDAMLVKADILVATGDTKAATAVLQSAYELAPSDAALAHSLGFRWAEAGNPKALKLADSLIAADVRGTHPEPFLIRGIFHASMKQPDLALKSFDEAIVKDYNFLDAHMYKGETLFNLGRFADAAEAFRLATTISPTFAEGYYWLAKSEQALGKKTEAAENFDRAYQLDSSLREANTPTP